MKWLRRVLLTLVLTLLLIVLALALLLGSNGGSRWLLERVPGLQVEQFEGRLGGAWRAARIDWISGGTQVGVEQIDFAWRAGCLWRRTLCIDLLQVARIDVQLAESESSAQEPFSGLPDLRLPLKLELGQIGVGAIDVQGQALGDIQLQARSVGSRLQIEQLDFVFDEIAVQLQGSIDTQGQWPLQLQAQVSLPPQQGRDWQLAASAVGELAGQLDLQIASSGYLDATLAGWLRPLEADLPAELTLQTASFLASAELPPGLTLQQLQLLAAGDLQQGYQLRGSAVLPAQGEPIGLSLLGQLRRDGLQLERLRLDAGSERYLQAQADIDWQASPSATLRLQLEEFPWQTLYPLELPVSLQSLQAQLDYANEAYQGTLDSRLDGPAGAFSLRTALSGDLGQLQLRDLLLQAGAGRIEGSARLQFAEHLAWEAALSASNFDPAFWVAELPGQLAGPLRSSGSEQADGVHWQVSVDLQGRLREQPASLQGEAAGQGERVQVPQLALRLGDNRVDGSLQSGQALDGGFDLQLARLDQLWPELSGALRARLDLAGRLDAPSARLVADAQKLRWQETRIGLLALQAQLDANQQGRLNLNAEALRQGDNELGTLTLNGQGGAAQHALRLTLDGPLLVAGLAVEGSWRDDAWRGRLEQARLQIEQMDWQLQQATALQRLADGRIELAAHCWALQQSSSTLCAGQQRLAPVADIDYRLRDFPLTMLRPWLGEDLDWQGELDAELRLQLPATGPRGSLRVDAGNGVLRSRDGQQWLELAYQRLSLESRLAPQKIDSRLQFFATDLGELDLQVAFDPRTGERPLQGEFRLVDVQLGIARPFLPMLDRLEGRLDGSGSIGGVLLSPSIIGSLRLRDGALAGDGLPLDAEQLQLDARINGEHLELDGNWRSGAQGRGQLQGHFSWAQIPELDLRLSGSRLPVLVEPYAQLEAEPDLRVQLAGERLFVSGRIAVPRGAIVINELPPDSVQISEDARVVGDEQEQGSALNMAMNVQVDVGSDKLTFEGFGLSAELAGQLRIGDNLDTRGELNLNKGRYRAYGQRLTIRRARLFFAGPIERPYLDIEAIRKVDNVTAGLRLSGPADQPQSEIFSEPAMAQEQALSYLILGRPMGNSGEDSNMLGQAALALGLAGSAKLTGGVARLLGISDFELDTQGSGLTTSVVASGRLSERLSLRYGVGVFEPASTLALRYELSRRLYLEAASGLASSLDLFYRRDF